eukprot:1344820-Rhodomonas_salina.1
MPSSFASSSAPRISTTSRPYPARGVQAVARLETRPGHARVRARASEKESRTETHALRLKSHSSSPYGSAIASAASSTPKSTNDTAGYVMRVQ